PGNTPRAALGRYAISGALSGAVDLLHHVRLYDIPFLIVGETIQHDTAFEAGRHLADVVFDVAQRRELPGEDGLLAAPHAHLGAASDHALGDHAPCDGAAGRAEGGARLGRAQNALGEDGGEHALHGRAHVIHQHVNDVIEADIDA